MGTVKKFPLDRVRPPDFYAEDYPRGPARIKPIPGSLPEFSPGDRFLLERDDESNDLFEGQTLTVLQEFLNLVVYEVEEFPGVKLYLERWEFDMLRLNQVMIYLPPAIEPGVK